MDKYILFAFNDQYASGGIGDIITSFSSIDGAKYHLENMGYHYDNAYILDRDTWETVWECD